VYDVGFYKTDGSHTHQGDRSDCSIVLTDHSLSHIVISWAQVKARLIGEVKVLGRRASGGASLQVIICIVGRRALGSGNAVLAVHLIEVVGTVGCPVYAGDSVVK
jgi:hypothetical protein